MLAPLASLWQWQGDALLLPQATDVAAQASANTPRPPQADLARATGDAIRRRDAGPVPADMTLAAGALFVRRHAHAAGADLAGRHRAVPGGAALLTRSVPATE